MTINWEADRLIAPRSENVNRYKRNFLQRAVCEFRFPTLMELGYDRPPDAFVKAIRLEYPVMEQANELTWTVGTASNQSVSSHIFRSAKLDWLVSLKESSFSVETTNYTTFLAMRERIARVIKAASLVIDSDFFTRIGLRYINVIESKHNPVNGWINPALIGPLRDGPFKGVQEFAGKIQVSAEDGGCLLQHGIRLNPESGKEKLSPDYRIDIDCYRNVISVKDALDAVDAVNAQAFSLFDWAIEDAAREYLSK